MRNVCQNEWGMKWRKVCNRTKGLSIMSCKTVCLKSFTNSSRRWLLKRKIGSCTSSDEKLFRDGVEKQRYVFRKKFSWQNKRRYKWSWKKRSQANPVQSLLLVCSSLEKQLLNKLPSFFLMEQCFRVQLLWLEKKVYLQDMAMREREADLSWTDRKRVKEEVEDTQSALSSRNSNSLLPSFQSSLSFFERRKHVSFLDLSSSFIENEFSFAGQIQVPSSFPHKLNMWRSGQSYIKE